MSVSSTSSSTASSANSGSTGTLGTNSGPISFTGLGSGIDSNSIIQKLTSITLAQAQPLQTRVSSLSNRNTELAKINGLLQQVQSSLQALSDPKTFGAYTGKSSNDALASLTQNTTGTTIPGTYTITSAQPGTATSVTSAATIAHKMSDLIGGTASTNVPLIDSYISQTPSNGTGSGSITIDGVSVGYDVTSQSLTQILSNIQAKVRSVGGDASFTATYNSATDTVSFSSSNKPITIGSAGDSGNLATVLKLDTAQINNTAGSGNVTSAGPLGGINPVENLSSTNPAGQTVNANLKTAVTAGTFTINGVKFTVTPTNDALSDVLTRINQSSAGVIASYDQTSGRITVTNKSAGSTNLVLGATGDSSNFLTATGLTSAAGGVTTAGTQAKVTYNDTAGNPHTVYSNSNDVTNAIPGQILHIGGTITAANPVTITVGQDPKTAETAINNFVTAYNNALNEINTATAAPIVQQSGIDTGPGQPAQQIGGGILYGNSQVSSIRQQLISLVSGLNSSTGSKSYNSLTSIGLSLNSQFTVQSDNSNNSNSSSNSSTSSTTNSATGITTTVLGGTSGNLSALDTSKFETAFAANPNAVSKLFTSTAGLSQQLGAYLTQTTGAPTLLANGLAGRTPAAGLLQTVENQNTSNITSLNRQIQLIQSQATAQANSLQQQFAASEKLILGYQQEQSSLAQIGAASSSG